MIKYGVKLPDGLWLDNEYGKRVSRCTSPTPDRSETPRLFTSPAGARSSLGCIATANVRALLPVLQDYQSPSGRWTDQDRDDFRTFWKEVRKVYSKLKGQAYWDMLAKDGYTLVPFAIEPATQQRN